MSQPSINQQLAELNAAVQQGKRAEVVELTKALLDTDAGPSQLVESMVAAMDEIGQQFQCQQIFIPQMLMASLAMSDAMTVIEPKLVEAGIQPKYRALIGTVAGDVHNIGKNLVAMMWKGAGFDVVDLGINVKAEQFLQAAEEKHPDLIGLSSLLTTTMPVVQSTLAALAPMRARGVRVMVGGAPITQSFAYSIGADGYAPDAASAVDVARRLVG